jgi:hypothetical protein
MSSASASALPVELCLDGTRFDKASFRFAEAGKLESDLLLEVIEGKLAGVIFRDLIPASDRKKIAENFRIHPHLYKRGSDAPALYLGSYHYNKELDHYLSEAALFDGLLDRVFEGTSNWHKIVSDTVREALAPHGGTLRMARHEGREAARFVMREWTGIGEYALLPHEDEAQCRSPKQRGFEIQAAARNAIAAVNMCLENGNAGKLHYWNIMPDDASRDALGLTYTGSPYPLESLHGVEKLVVEIRPGDVYCFNGKAVHAVESLAGAHDRRSTISYLMARLDAGTVIQWT